jgi:hypothetical protein
VIWSRRASILFAVVLAGAGCQDPRGPVSITSDDPDLKIQAMKQDAVHPRQADTPKLVESLQSDDPAIRFYAVQALRRITHDDFGYRFYDDDDQRAPATAKWQAWLKKQAR